MPYTTLFRSVRVHLLVHLPGVEPVLVAVAAIEDDHLDGGFGVDTEGVVVGDLAFALGHTAVAVVTVIAAAARGASAQRGSAGSGPGQAEEQTAGGTESLRRGLQHDRLLSLLVLFHCSLFRR